MALSKEELPDIWQMIEPYFTSQPSHLALTSTHTKLTYGQLQTHIGKLGQLLSDTLPTTYKEGKRSLILHLPNSVAFLLSVTTCVSMKQPFTPLPVDYPEGKQQMVLEDVKGAAVLTTKDKLTKQIFGKVEVLATISAETISVEEDLVLVYLNQYEGQVDLDDDCCYTIYTSGSTGKPKGVQCLRKGVSNLARGQIEFWDMSKEDVSGQFASVAYDAVISEVFVALASGGTLAAIGLKERAGIELENTIKSLEINVITLVPNLLNSLKPADFPTITKLITAGEAATKELARKWYRNGKIRMFNAYGPAENTVCATMFEVTEETLKEGQNKDEALPIGKGMRGVEIRLLNQDLKDVPKGEEGEIYIGGLSLSKGYIGHAFNMNTERFIQDPTNPSARLYKTGDLAVTDARGDLIFTGRVDDQIKINGQMVNPTGVETVLRSCPGVEMAVIVGQERREGTGQERRRETKLVAFLSPKSLNPDVVKKHIQGLLSVHERPVSYVLLEKAQYPLNNNDKIDRKLLQKMCPGPL